MADKIIQFLDDSGDLVPVKAVDNGDGTYKVQVDAAVTMSGLSVGAVDQGDAGSQAWLVTGPLTDTQLRASDVKVSLDSELVTISGVASLLPGTYLGQQVLSFVSAANQNATIPTGTKGIWITAEGGKVYAAINTTAAPTSAGVYISDGNTRFTGSYNGISSLGVYAASGIYAHLIYES
jgi:hypothetical protein